MLYVITCGVSQGRKVGLLSAAGISLGVIVHTFAAAFGLAVLLKTSVVAFLVVKYVGAAYLIYLGIQALLNKNQFVAEETDSEKNSGNVFWKGVLTNVLNPKVALFFLAFLPQFVNTNGSNMSVQMIILGLIFIAFSMTFLSVVGYFSGRIGSWLRNKPWIAKRIKWMTSFVFIGLGVRLLFLKRV
jgi:threonine/homoserine/homoserine lactone efflux protein